VDAVCRARDAGCPTPPRTDPHVQYCTTALPQMAAEELDLAMSQAKSIRLESHTMPNQGGTVASAPVACGGPRIRSAAAEARQALVKWPRRSWTHRWIVSRFSQGVVTVAGNPRKSVTELPTARRPDTERRRPDVHRLWSVPLLGRHRVVARARQKNSGLP
jgi:CO/xanthine dehydrogenase Mo-binding subunit